MRHTTLADTGLTLSLLGLGTVKFGRNTGVKYPQPFDLPDLATMRNLLAIASDGGINLLDTAPAYGSSEIKLGELIRGQRERWILCTKAGEEFDPASATSCFDFSPEALTRSVERSLQRLGTEVLDLVLVHSNGDDEQIILRDGALDTLNRLKQKGWIRATGMSTKTAAGGLLALQQADCVMIAFNPDYPDERPVIDYAAQHNKGILIKKLLNSGHAVLHRQGLQHAVDIARATPGITSVIMGTCNPEHLRQNIQLFSGE
jgi:aryl-alcohol dehydrogenase-like predicted oxidoreductase